MLITALCDYYDTLRTQGKVIPEGYSQVEIHYLLSLDESGRLCSVIDYQDTEYVEIKGKQKEVRHPHPVYLPTRTEKSGIEANIIEHRPLYIFGLNYDNKTGTLTPDDRTGKAQKSHADFLKSNLAFIEGIDTPIVNAYRNFMNTWNPAEETQNPLLAIGKAFATARFAFCLQGHPEILLHEDPLIRQRWESFCKERNDQADSVVARCCITGQKAPIARIHAKIKGVPGGSSMGNTVICFNNPAEYSYGKEQSYNSYISDTAMLKYTQALNYLMKSRHHRALIDDTVYVFWAASGDEHCDDMMNALAFGDAPDAAETEQWLDSVFTGIRAGKASSEILANLDGLDGSIFFYIVGFKPNSARLAMKCLYRQRFGSILENTIQHYKDLQIGIIDRPISFNRIRKELVSPKSNKDTVSTALMAKIMEAVFKGTPYPNALLETIIRRVKTDSDTETNHYIQMNDIRIGIIKACINRKARLSGKKEEIKMSLDLENRSPAYLCGRLFCKLEQIQKRALGENLNRTIKDSYFSSAATRPAITFPRLIQLAQHHLKKLDDKTAYYMERDMGEIVDSLQDNFPSILTLKEQGEFILGYYQQKNEPYTKAASAKETVEK